MSSQAAGETVLLIFVLIGIIGVWDGIVRRHIRLTLDVLQLHINVRGIPAILLGSLSGFVLYLAVKIGSSSLVTVINSCHSSAGCVIQQALLPAITTWQTAVVMCMFIVLFAFWLRGASDLHGPYRRFWLAPGVWYSEKDIIAYVSQRVPNAHISSADDDSIVKLASLIRKRIPLYTSAAPEEVLRGEHLDHNAITEVLLTSKEVKRLRMSAVTKRSVIAIIVEYYDQTYARAAEKRASIFHHRFQRF